MIFCQKRQQSYPKRTLNRRLTEASRIHAGGQRLGSTVFSIKHETPSQLRRRSGTLAETDVRRLIMLHVSLWGADSVGWTLADAEAKLRANPAAFGDLQTILQFLLSHTRPIAFVSSITGPLAIHAEYTRDEVLVGLGHWTLENRPGFREGVLHLPDTKVDAFFVTLQKTEEQYSPTTKIPVVI